MGPSWGDLGAILGQRWAKEAPKGGPKIELKRGRGGKNRVWTLLNRSETLLDAILSPSSAIFIHLQRSEVDLTAHVRSVLALLHSNEPRRLQKGAKSPQTCLARDREASEEGCVSTSQGVEALKGKVKCGGDSGELRSHLGTASANLVHLRRS